MGSSFASEFPRGSVAEGEYDDVFNPVEEEKEKESNKLDTVKFIQQMKDMTDHEKKITETFLKFIYSKNKEDFDKCIINEVKNVNYN